MLRTSPMIALAIAATLAGVFTTAKRTRIYIYEFTLVADQPAP
ncbi:MAG TPA: hypothetical protein VNI79_02545 [Sphingomicrobium sp.]|nr:hypothetical protein [Sphingomicrobium sp.]